MIVSKITQQIGEALKARDEVRLSTLRMLSSALSYEKIAKQHELTDEEELVVIRKEAKKRVDAIEALRQAQGKLTQNPESIPERLAKEEKELAILKEYLPADMGEDELEKLVEQAIKESDLPADATPQALQAGMGKVIGLVVSKSGGRVDGGRVSAVVKEKLFNVE